jgi:hypothetical protein
LSFGTNFMYENKTFFACFLNTWMCRVDFLF